MHIWRTVWLVLEPLRVLAGHAKDVASSMTWANLAFLCICGAMVDAILRVTLPRGASWRAGVRFSTRDAQISRFPFRTPKRQVGEARVGEHFVTLEMAWLHTIPRTAIPLDTHLVSPDQVVTMADLVVSSSAHGAACPRRPHVADLVYAQVSPGAQPRYNTRRVLWQQASACA